VVKITIQLRPKESEKLRQVSRRERRPPADQASLILAEALAAIDVKKSLPLAQPNADKSGAAP
jgi:hypothetical protein